MEIARRILSSQSAECAEPKRKRHGLQLMFPLVFHDYPKECQELDLRIKGLISPHLKLLREHWSAGRIERECRDISIRSTACLASIKRGDETMSTPQNMRKWIRVGTLRNRLYGTLRRNVLEAVDKGRDMPFRDMELEVLVDAMEREVDPDWTVLFEDIMKCPDTEKAREMTELTQKFLTETGFRDPKNYFCQRYERRCSQTHVALKKYTKLPVKDVYLSGSSARKTSRRADIFSGLHRSDLDIVLVLDPDWAWKMKPAEVALKVQEECERLLVEYFFDPYFENMFADIAVSKGSYCVNLSREPNAFFPLRLDVDVVPAIPNPEGGEYILNMKEGVWFKSNHKLHLKRWNEKLQKDPMTGKIIFMLKVWNSCNGNLRQGRKPMFKGIHFEALLLNWIPKPVRNEAEALLDAIAYINCHFREPFVAGDQRHASGYITEDPILLQCVEEKLGEATAHLSAMCEILQGRPVKDLNLDETYELSKGVALLCGQDVEIHEKPLLFLEFIELHLFLCSETHVFNCFVLSIIWFLGYDFFLSPKD